MSEKPIYYTHHARSRMCQHRISEESVVLAIEEPDQLLPSIRVSEIAIMLLRELLTELFE